MRRVLTHPQNYITRTITMPSATAPQHLFATMLARVRAACAGVLGPDADTLARRGRAAARSDPRRPRDQRRHGAGQGCRQKAARAGRENRRGAARRRSRRQGRRRRARLHQSDAQAACLGRGAARRAGGGQRLRPQRHRAGREGQCRICLGQSDRADACRPRPRRGVRRRARQSPGLRRLRGDARILHQRRRRAGRRARALGLPALPRGARRGYRRDPGRALSGRLSRAGRRRARRRAWRGAQRQAGEPNGCRSCAPKPSR